VEWRHTLAFSHAAAALAFCYWFSDITWPAGVPTEVFSLGTPALQRRDTTSASRAAVQSTNLGERVDFFFESKCYCGRSLYD
jgi:hypothetical protein